MSFINIKYWHLHAWYTVVSCLPARKYWHLLDFMHGTLLFHVYLPASTGIFWTSCMVHCCFMSTCPQVLASSGLHAWYTVVSCLPARKYWHLLDFMHGTLLFHVYLPASTGIFWTSCMVHCCFMSTCPQVLASSGLHAWYTVVSCLPARKYWHLLDFMHGTLLFHVYLPTSTGIFWTSCMVHCCTLLFHVYLPTSTGIFWTSWYTVVSCLCCFMSTCPQVLASSGLHAWYTVRGGDSYQEVGGLMF